MKFATGQSTIAWQFTVLAMFLWLAPGCSGRPKNIARRVSGKVTLGGQPLANAIVGFAPVEGGSAALGKTDENGNYKLVWSRSGTRILEGAKIG